MTQLIGTSGTTASRMILILLLEAIALCFLISENQYLHSSRAILSFTTKARWEKSSSSVRGSIVNVLQKNSSKMEGTELKVLPEEDSQAETNPSKAEPDVENSSNEESSKETGTELKNLPTGTSPSKKESKDERRIDRIVVLGERHSGTTYATGMLRKCFPGLDVSPNFLRWKHWFQPAPEYVVNATARGLQGNGNIAKGWQEIAESYNPKSFYKNTLVIFMVRSAYDWIEAMRKKPHHWPNHFHLKGLPNANITEKKPLKMYYGSESLPWTEFIAANLTYVHPYGTVPSAGGFCQQAMLPGTVSPCRTSKETYPEEVKRDYDYNLAAAPNILPLSIIGPIYEHDADGKPFEHPLGLRAAKIRNFLDVPNKWDLGGFVTVHFEDMNTKGSGFILDAVSKITGVDTSCEPDPPKKQAMEPLDRQWTEWITEHADWDAEALVGYKPHLAEEEDRKVENKSINTSELVNVHPEEARLAVDRVDD